MTATEQALETYRQLLAKVDAKFGEIAGAHSPAMQCRLGCHSCCKPGLTVSELEAENLRRHFRADPESRRRLEENTQTNPHHGTRCSLLDAKGACVAYAARPIVCRSHGVPIKVRDAGGDRLDVCPLNFADVDLSALPATDHINLETLNTLLSLLNRQFSGDLEQPRKALSAAGLSIDSDS